LKRVCGRVGRGAQPDLNLDLPCCTFSAPGHFMSMIDDDLSLTTADLYEELIFLIATASTDTQRKRATELFRRFARRVVVDAFQQGQDSVRPTLVAAPSEAAEIALAAPAKTLAPDHLVSLIPKVSWGD
jgi:hypothetical protein